MLRVSLVAFLFVFIALINAQGFCPIQNVLPSEASDSLGRCSQYSNLSCCSSMDVERLDLWVEDEQIELTYETPECLEMLNSLFCGGLCSPCQSRFVSVSQNGTVFTICENYCESIYSSCSDETILGNTTVGEFLTAEQFCRAVAPLDITIEVSSSGGCFANDDPLESCRPGFASNLSTVECPTDNCLNPFTVGETIRYSIQAVDEEGNPITVGGDFFTAVVEGPGFVSPYVIDNNNGIYTVLFWTYLAGNYTIQTFLASQPNEPLRVCEIFVNPGDSYALNFETGNACDLGPAFFTIQTIDKFGNLMNRGGLSFDIDVQGPAYFVDGQEQFYSVDVSIEDNQDGTYTVAYQTPAAGEYSINILANGQPIMGSPYAATLFAGTFSAENSFAFGSGLRGPQLINEVAQFFIQPVDSCGNLILEDVVEWSASINGVNVPFSIPVQLEYVEAGVTSVTYLPTAIGIYTITVTPADSEELISPTPTVIEVTDAFGVGATVATSQAPNRFFVQTRDCLNQTLEEGGQSFELELSYRGQPVQSAEYSFTDLGNGLYVLEYTGAFFGALDLSVNRVGDTSLIPIFGSPLNVQFINGAPCPNNCSNNGYCQNGECVCALGFSGVSCNQAGAPFVTSATFSQVGVTINVRFNGPTNRASMNVVGSCNSIFTAATVALFGTNSRCIWRSAQELVIVLGTGTQVDPGTELTFAPNVIVAAGGNSPAASGSFPVLLPSDPVGPYIQIVGPSEVSSCDTSITFDARSSLGRAGRELTFEWGLLMESDNPTQREILLDQRLRQETGPLVTFPTDIFPTDSQIVITCTATNILGGTSVVYLPLYRASIRTSSPTVLIQAPRVLRVQPSQSFTLTARTTLPCGVGSTVSYAWTRVDLNGPSLTLDLPTSVSSSLYIPPGTFSANAVFYLEVSAALDGRSDLLSRDRITIIVDPPQDYAQISFRPNQPTMLAINSNRRRFARSSQLTLNAASSTFLDLNDGSFSYDWDCWALRPRRCEFCLDEDGKRLYIGTNNSRVVFPGATFQPGEYAFQVKVTDKLGGIQSSIAVVDLVAARVPEVFILPIRMQRVPAGIKLNLESTVVSTTGRSPSLRWTVDPPELLDLNDESIVATSRNSPLLILNPNTLFEQVTYTFRLSATDSVTGTGYADITFTVNAAPVAGTFTVSPSSGIGGSTRFNFVSNGWEDPTFDLPLSYTFARVNSAGNEVPLIADPVPINAASFQLPTGTTLAVAYIYDSWGASTRVTFPVTVTASATKRQAGPRALLDEALVYMQQLEEAVDQQDQANIIQFFGIVLEVLNDPSEVPSSPTDLSERQQIRNRLSQILSNNLIVGGSPNARSLVINFIHQLTFRAAELNSEAQLRISAFFATVTGNWVSTGIATNDNDIERLASLLANAAGKLLAAQKEGMSVEEGRTMSNNVIRALRFTSQSMLFERSQLETELQADGEDVVILTGRRSSTGLPTHLSALDTSIAIPSAVSQRLLGLGIEEVDYFFVAFENNPYFYSSSSRDLHTKLSLLEFLQQGQHVELTDLSSPVEISLPTRDPWPYVLCQFFDEQLDEWSPQGCQATASSTPGETVCQCNHLSVFSARSVPAPPFAEGAAVSNLIPSQPIEAEQLFLIPWWLVLLVAVILMLIAFGTVSYRKQIKEFVYKSDEVEAIPSVVEHVEQGMVVLPMDEEVYMDRKKLMDEESSEESLGLRRPVLPPLEESSEEDEEMGRRKIMEEESSDEDEVQRVKAAMKEESSDEEEEAKRAKALIKEESSDEEEEAKRAKTLVKEESSDEEEAQRIKAGVKEESSDEEEEAKRAKTTVKEESSEEEPEEARTKTAVQEESSEDEEVLTKAKTTQEEDSSSDDAKDQ